jgi:death-on-curing protein
MFPPAIFYLTVEDVIERHCEVTRAAGTQAVLLDRAKLESAVLRPRNAAFYEGADLFQQAALLLAGIALAHAFSDGNKRTAALAAETFIAVNRFMLQFDGVDYAHQVEALVNHTESLTGATQRLGDWLRDHAVPR